MKKKNLILSLIFLFIFLLMIVLLKTVDYKAVGYNDTCIGLSTINKAISDKLSYNKTWYTISGMIGYLSIATAILFVVVGIIQLAKRKKIKEIDKEIIGLGCLYVCLAILYVLFNNVIINYRPFIVDGETELEASFPSSHTMLMVGLFGSTFLVIDKYIKQDTLKKILWVLLIVLAIIGPVTRLLSGVHWFTDILAGAIISLSLVFGFNYFLELNKEYN